jgi:ABC-type polysaccharide/polyol phosphate export permease
MNSQQIFAIAKKELKLNLRFKYNYFLNELSKPLKIVVLFLIVYAGFFISGANNVGGVTKENYVSFLLLGSLVSSVLLLGFDTFNQKFMQEKFWKTIQAVLIAPLNKIKLILGVGISELLIQGIIVSIFLIITIIVLPVSFVNLLIVLLILLLIFLGVLGFSLIYGAFSLSNENFLFLFRYFVLGWAFLSCFYYPVEILPSFIKPFVLINPVYHGLFIIRNLWINGFVNNFLMHFIIVLAFAVVVPIIAVYLFNKIIKKLGIQGY